MYFHLLTISFSPLRILIWWVKLRLQNNSKSSIVIADLDESSDVVSISPIMIGEIDEGVSDDSRTGDHST